MLHCCAIFANCIIKIGIQSFPEARPTWNTGLHGLRRFIAIETIQCNYNVKDKCGKI